MKFKQDVQQSFLIIMIFMYGCVHPLPPAPTEQTTQAAQPPQPAQSTQPVQPAPPVPSEKPDVQSGKSEVQKEESPRELMVKEYLINKYKPGTCYGTPGSQQETDRHQIQLREIVLIPIDQGYGFILKDGHCCSVYSYQGKIIMDGDNIIDEKITNKSIDAIPC